ncbi:3-carboxyethylcatechol 2,3-dioxygenase [Mycobacterium xenopi]|uniref:2,3-dihydroxyphenylpropionate/2,3-dihydroxicinnam ic acid 1,2-dioxygenase n=1 Tax=Mycobacterium xenopi TaxID=1789 RepID=A0AAD1M064_MYCXE|nr:3-carboxyethylcatechol 2,3-dioxygenase [Mycobacterium xenopi]MDA3639683.1 3-carboxyethylcatechol 2,3-dioxygenase [Mycobacterium xenopi]MDA3657933.1 3-carboxyethylcatechol 2,3-dioxygenase [Mycobacterium xenopi]MDA3663550.1 3-carboxyethylcatechol 2,3-dioxygenase [Mycobacterium xenopi]SPX78985.1 3-(2,3-dihydroxyphenyl)propionate dioxygenase [Mycobacterium xenopi]BBU21115.1 2,3-dihydroxyphenylpropionate/2,3-dihydroxicinnam ic acid 1,2-dioxygenase [Mycobacterium xenopi]
MPAVSSRRLVVCASHSPGKERDVEQRFGRKFRAALAAAAKEVERFDPELVVLFGGDHRRAFRHVVPAFAVTFSASIIAEGPHPAGQLTVPSAFAQHLADHLLGEGFDIAVCRDVGLDHAFAQPIRDLLGRLDAKPVIPVPVNCATAPLPNGRRVVEFGTAVGRFLDDVDHRVLLIGTGGLSHSPPSLEVDTYNLSDEERARLIAQGMADARTKIRPEWDGEVLQAMSRWDVDALIGLVDSAQARAGSGANEIRTWVAAGAAGGGKPLTPLVYEPVAEWITGMGVAISASTLGSINLLDQKIRA